ncbi:MAG: hypothetical protein R2747_02790 [Pyrinomonadaceae bacterium]
MNDSGKTTAGPVPAIGKTLPGLRIDRTVVGSIQGSMIISSRDEKPRIEKESVLPVSLTGTVNQ